jgi:Ca-activated chloride channel family protein
MSGQPLQEAKRCAGFIVDGLDPGDRASLLAYDHRVDVLVPSRPVADRATFHTAIAAIHEGGMTALYDGWRLGADQAMFAHEEGMLSRVLLLSDGNANRGLAELDGIAARCARVAESGVSTSTYGLGHHFNEELMMAMARAGGGNGYYGEAAEDLIDPFREELDLLGALCARHLRLSLEAPLGVGITLLNGYERDPDGWWRLPDLAYGGEAWALVELKVPARLEPNTLGGEIEVLRATLEMKREDSGVETAGPARLRLPFLPAAAYAALAEHDLVRRRAQEIQAANVQDAARTAARRHDWERVEELLREARVEARDNPWLQDSLAALERLASQRHTEGFSKEALYSSGKLRARLADPDEASAQYDLALEAGKAAYLRRKLEQGKRLDRPSSANEQDN